MRSAITATGSTKFKIENEPISDALERAALDLIDNNSIERGDIDAVLVSTNDNSKYLAAILSETCGLGPKISHTVENLCSSGTNAIVSGISYVESGIARSVLVVGGDRTDCPGHQLDWDSSRGRFSHPIFWATIFTKSYKSRFGVDENLLAAVPARNRKNALDNPNACQGRVCTISDILNSRQITSDLRLLDCSRPCTGASAVLITAESVGAVRVRGIGHRTSSAGISPSQSFSEMKTVAEASEMAYKSARIQPCDVDVAEVHDAFSVCEPMALEAMKIAKPGQGARLAVEMMQTGDRKVNPRGGILGSGHPLGATGVAQVAEIVSQLQHNAGRRQADNARIGIVQNMSAAATSSTVLVLES